MNEDIRRGLAALAIAVLLWLLYLLGRDPEATGASNTVVENFAMGGLVATFIAVLFLVRGLLSPGGDSDAETGTASNDDSDDDA